MKFTLIGNKLNANFGSARPADVDTADLFTVHYDKNYRRDLYLEVVKVSVIEKCQCEALIFYDYKETHKGILIRPKKCDSFFWELGDS